MTKEKEVAVAETKTARAPRKKVYERTVEAKIPDYLVKKFKKDNYDLRLIRWIVQGEEDYRNLSIAEKEGYEYVKVDEVPEEFLTTVKVRDSAGRKGLITLGDLVLMKMDSDLRKSRTEAYEQDARDQLASVDVHVLEKKGLLNTGSRSRVMYKEPTFQE